LFAIAFCKKPEARTSSMKLLTGGQNVGPALGHDDGFAERRNRLSGNSSRPGCFAHQRREALPVGAKGRPISFPVSKRWIPAGLFSTSSSVGLLQLALQIERNGIVPDAGYDLSGAIEYRRPARIG
jgi:hypothetical protein